MGLQKYRFDITNEPEPNGSIELRTEWLGGPSLAGVRNCPCSDGVARMVFVQGEADTMFTVPAACSIKGKRQKGNLTHDEAGWMFNIFPTTP